MKQLRLWVPLGLLAAAAVAFWVVQARDPVHGQWKDRVTLPGCGSVVLSEGETLRQDATSELACLRTALQSGTGAELKVERPTVEGDPYWTYYRVNPDGTTEAYDDATSDPYGSGGWSFVQCRAPSSVLDVSC